MLRQSMETTVNSPSQRKPEAQRDKVLRGIGASK